MAILVALFSVCIAINVYNHDKASVDVGARGHVTLSALARNDGPAGDAAASSPSAAPSSPAEGGGPTQGPEGPSEEEPCVLLSSFFAMSIQVLLVLTCVSVLVLKWYLERPRRLCYVFLMDGSKQLFGTATMHVWNLVFSICFDKWITIGDECRWYLVNSLVDTVLGLAVSLALLQMSMFIFKYDTGSYMSPDGVLMIRPWVTQTAHWVLIISTMKFINAGIVLLTQVQCNKFAAWFLSAFSSKDTRLLVVMILVPGAQNCLEFVVRDQWLKHTEPKKEEVMSGVDESAKA